MSRRVRVGMIGTGRTAAFVHLPGLRLSPSRCEVTAVASRDPAVARTLSGRRAIPRVHATWDALVRGQ